MVIPIGDRLIIQPQHFNTETVSASGIVYGTENTNITQTSRGTVLSFGTGVKSDELQQPNVDVYYEEFAGHKINMDGQEVLIVQEMNILGVIKND